jgi:hypothetical protein
MAMVLVFMQLLVEVEEGGRSYRDSEWQRQWHVHLQ